MGDVASPLLLAIKVPMAVSEMSDFYLVEMNYLTLSFPVS